MKMKEKLNCVLLIDDDEPTNYLNELIIEEADISKSVIAVQSARQALELLSKPVADPNLQPELIFLDINMPAMNGWDFMESYRVMKQSFLKHPVIVMLTSSINPDDEMRANNIDEINEYQRKPLSEVVLTTVLKKHFPDRV